MTLQEFLQTLALGFQWRLGIFFLEWLVRFIWLADRGAVFLYQKAVTDGWLMGVREQMLASFAGMMPGVLQRVVFGRGLMYVALVLSGIVMMVPLWSRGTRPVQTERVVVWGVLLTALFISGTLGYDLIGAVEGMRQGMVREIVQGDSLPLDRLVLQPMLAGSGDLGFGGELFTLPPGMVATYFPEVQEQEVSLVAITVGEWQVALGTVLVEPSENAAARMMLAAAGFFFGLVSLVGAWILLLAGLCYGLLSFAALVLILFLLVSLPLGFFEFGGLVLGDILGRYMQVVIHSLALAVLLRWMGGGLAFLVEVNSVPNAMVWMVVLGVLGLILWTFLKGALRLLMSSGEVISRTLNGFGGPGIMDATRQVIQVGTSVAGGVALLSGNASMALASAAVRGMMDKGGAPTTIPSQQVPPQVEMPRGNVFMDNGGAG